MLPDERPPVKAEPESRPRGGRTPAGPEPYEPDELGTAPRWGHMAIPLVRPAAVPTGREGGSR